MSEHNQTMAKKVDLKLTQRDKQIVVSVSLETKMTTMQVWKES